MLFNELKNKCDLKLLRTDQEYLKKNKTSLKSSIS